jgi:hypothetical protein
MTYGLSAWLDLVFITRAKRISWYGQTLRVSLHVIQRTRNFTESIEAWNRADRNIISGRNSTLISMKLWGLRLEMDFISILIDPLHNRFYVKLKSNLSLSTIIQKVGTHHEIKISFRSTNLKGK